MCTHTSNFSDNFSQFAPLTFVFDLKQHIHIRSVAHKYELLSMVPPQHLRLVNSCGENTMGVPLLSNFPSQDNYLADQRATSKHCMSFNSYNNRAGKSRTAGSGKVRDFASMGGAYD